MSPDTKPDELGRDPLGLQRGAAACLAARARESLRADGLFRDVGAERAVRGEHLVALATLGGDPLADAIAVRTRFIDEQILLRVGPGVAVVNLGAGHDTRRERLGLEGLGLRWIDVDCATRGHAPAGVRAIQGDVCSPRTWLDVERALEGHGGRTIFVAEGLLGYLEARCQAALLELVRRHAPGAWTLIFDAPDEPARRRAALPMRPGFDLDGLAVRSDVEVDLCFLGHPRADFGRLGPMRSGEVTRAARTYLVVMEAPRRLGAATSAPLVRFYRADRTAERTIGVDRTRDHELVAQLLTEGAGKRLLDLGCGEGRIAIPLAERGYRVTAIDHDPRMLDMLRESLERAGSRIARNLRVLRRDACMLGAIGPLHDSALLMFDVLAVILDDRDRMRLLGGVRRNLRRRGRVVIDSSFPADTGIHVLDGVDHEGVRYRRVMSVSEPDDQGIVSIEGRYVLERAEREIPFFFRARPSTPTEVMRLLARSGFREIREAWTDGRRRSVVMARR